MFESETYEVILKRMLNRVPKTIDTQEGSIVYNALAPAAIELATAYIKADTIISQTFASTANREYLILRAKERGIVPKEASKAVVKGEFNCEIEIGARFTCDTLVYAITEKISNYTYKMECETAGKVGNKSAGTLIPINYVSGLTSANIIELLIPGEDEEDTEVFRQRYFDTFEAQAYGGNRADYINKVTAISGVGACKCRRITNENDNIKITIINSEYKKASDELVETVQNVIDKENDGEGTSVAPINHFVKINTVEENNLTIKVIASYDTGYTFDTLKSAIKNKIETYLDELRQTWANQTNLIVRIALLKARILEIDGILDIEDGNLLINGTASNLTLGEYEIPVLNEVTNE